MVALAQKYLDELKNGRPVGDDEFVYRSGGFTESNFTPNLFKDKGKSDFNGLSVSLDPPEKGNYQKLSVAKLRAFGFVIINDHGRHATISPPTARELVLWALSRKGPLIHERTKQAMASRVDR
jgi:hypothetical protein